MSLCDSFVKRVFLDNYQKDKSDPFKSSNLNSVEFIIKPVCNLACKYCYIHNYGDVLYPVSKYNRESILFNLDLLLNWLIENNYKPKVDLFSGEFLHTSLGSKVLNIFYDKYRCVSIDKRVPRIIIPTNYTFLFDRDRTLYIENMICKFDNIGIDLLLSASVDGKYMEINRPFKSSKYQYTDEFYDRMFEFNKKHNMGFHPMVYSNNIEQWIDNFLWFQDNFKKHGIPYYGIYLLEVRNKEWTIRQVNDFVKFIKFIIRWTFENCCDSDKEEFFKFLMHYRGYNIISSALATIGRGLGCSLQSGLYIRLGDLSLFPCHRLMYDDFQLGKFNIVNGGLELECDNLELFTAIISADFKTFPMCESCLIKSVCSGGCLGSQYEVTGDLFAPIPTVCRLEHAKIYAIAKVFQELGILNYILSYVDDKIAFTFKKIKGGL